MTSVRSMRVRAALVARLSARNLAGLTVVLMSVTAMIAGGCQHRGPKLEPPSVLISPYRQPQLWAVVPPMNESGVSHVDELLVADMMVQEAEQIIGVTVLPVNRVVRAMRELELDVVTTAEDATLLAGVLDVDALVVGTVTAYDPYRPPVLGMALQLFRRDMSARTALSDTVQLTRSPTGEVAPAEYGPPPAVAQASGVFDASNHRVLLWLDQYATGRAMPETAYGSRIYLVRMDMYTKFVSHRLLGDLLEAEYCRLLREAQHAFVR